MKTIGLTGNVASGKSTVARVWADAGVPVVSADELARTAVAPGSPGLAAVVDTFGEEVLTEEGALDRGALRARIVADADARARLEAIVHPIVRQLRDAWLRRQAAAGAQLAAAEIPLLFEVGGAGEMDRVVVVHAPEGERLRRLVEERGLAPEEARALMATQGDPEEKRVRADHVVENAGTLAELETAARDLLVTLRAEVGGGADTADEVDGPAPSGRAGGLVAAGGIDDLVGRRPTARSRPTGRGRGAAAPDAEPRPDGATRDAEVWPRQPRPGEGAFGPIPGLGDIVVGEPPGSPAPQGFMRLDLHMHTWGSWDCLSDPERILERALARGVERIALTDHNRLDVALRMAERYPDRIIAGEEVKTEEGIDVIGLYLTEEIPKGTRARDTVNRIRRQGGIAYLPHPYASGKGGGGRYADELAGLCEIVEVFNARLHPGRLNAPALELARRHGRLPGAGSDAHTVGEVAGAWVEVPRHPNTPDGLREALRHARVHGTMSPWWIHLASTWAKVRKKVPGAPGE
jgi:dephospho-CoA kinase